MCVCVCVRARARARVCAKIQPRAKSCGLCAFLETICFLFFLNNSRSIDVDKRMWNLLTEISLNVFINNERSSDIITQEPAFDKWVKETCRSLEIFTYLLTYSMVQSPS